MFEEEPFLVLEKNMWKELRASGSVFLLIFNLEVFFHFFDPPASVLGFT